MLSQNTLSPKDLYLTFGAQSILRQYLFYVFI
ncbi:Uncharacterised protein [uncultured Bacteroides sp.]|nr:Uncharacterised protein [uncultured Bacteroides sp.]